VDRVVAPTRAPEDDADDAALRPRTFAEFVGQRKVADNLSVYVTAARKRGGPLDHVLLSGPPGLGKTTLAHVIAHELGVEAHVTSGPALERKGDLAGILTSLKRGDVLFIDEIHRLSPVVEESLYPAMEDFRIEIVTGVGAGATALNLGVERFTLVGATTRTGQLTTPMLSRFGIVERFDYYAPAELTTIVKRSAGLLGIPIDEAGAQEIGRRARGTPRIANRLLRRVRDFAEVRGDGAVDRDAAKYALSRLEVDEVGLDASDRRYLRALIERFDGGPAGVESLAAAMSEDRDTLEYVIEPYLIQEDFVQRTPRGRVAARRAYEHLGLPPKKPGNAGQGSLF
jgi:Holliday junction DNA helicase RuvB